MKELNKKFEGGIIMKMLKFPRQNGYIVTIAGSDGRGVTETGHVTWQYTFEAKRTYLRRFRRKEQLVLKRLLGLKNKVRGERLEKV